MAINNSIPKDYLANSPQLRPFYSHFPSQESIPDLIRQRSAAKSDRNLLVQTLLEQYQGMENADKSLAHIRQLADDNTFTIATGHQLCFLGGPMFTPYKILTVIRYCEFLKEKHPEHNFIPILWIASEDHDAEEINHFYSDYQQKWEYQGEIKGAVGRHKLIEIDLATENSSLQELFATYEPGKSLASAFFGFIHSLFHEYGLVIIDADRAALKRSMIPVFEAELKQGTAFKALNETSQRLEDANYPRQVHPREINLFYLLDELRERIVRDEAGTYQVLNTELQFSQDEIIAELHDHPERFSPNVALRPLYQEHILPNLAYAGGWGELSYWMQFKGMFDAFGVSFPMLVPRFSATLFRAEEAEAWQNLNLELKDADLEIHQLFDKYVPNLFDEKKYWEEGDKVIKGMQDYLNYMTQLDPTLGRSVAGEKVRLEKSLEKMLKKAKKSIRNQNPAPFRQIESLKNKIQPERLSQQRQLNLSAFLDAHAPKELLSFIYSQIHPFDFDHKWIVLP